MEEEVINEEDLEAEDDVGDIPRWIKTCGNQNTIYESPIDINITKTIEIELPPLEWHNYDVVPKKMKMTNTGYTLTLSAKWHQERPFINQGPFLNNYVFSQLHFHWGKNDAEGSEHTMDGVRYPIEMHMVLFKACYLTQEAAMKEKDGIAVLAYVFKLQSGQNSAFQILIENILEVQQAQSSFKMTPIPLSTFVKKFDKDYFLYWGSVTTSICVHYILWLITREPVGVSAEQVEQLRSMFDVNDEILQGNFRELQPLGDRKVYHVCPSTSKYATLLALP